jgi:hypothetical protein
MTKDGWGRILIDKLGMMKKEAVVYFKILSHYLSIGNVENNETISGKSTSMPRNELVSQNPVLPYEGKINIFEDPGLKPMKFKKTRNKLPSLCQIWKQLARERSF